MRRVIFLDRDGTMNVDHGYVYRIEEWEFIDGAIEALRRLQSNGYALALITNQSGVGCERYTLDDVHRLHAFVSAELLSQNVRLDAIAICPHQAADNCTCRKPRTGLYAEIAAAIGEPIDRSRSWTIGDTLSDVQFGRALGTRTVLLKSRYWDLGTAGIEADLITDRLLSAADGILKR